MLYFQGNCVVILTSNLGSEHLMRVVGTGRKLNVFSQVESLENLEMEYSTKYTSHFGVPKGTLVHFGNPKFWVKTPDSKAGSPGNQAEYERAKELGYPKTRCK